MGRSDALSAPHGVSCHRARQAKTWPLQPDWDVTDEHTPTISRRWSNNNLENAIHVGHSTGGGEVDVHGGTAHNVSPRPCSSARCRRINAEDRTTIPAAGPFGVRRHTGRRRRKTARSFKRTLHLPSMGTTGLAPGFRKHSASMVVARHVGGVREYDCIKAFRGRISRRFRKFDVTTIFFTATRQSANRCRGGGGGTLMSHEAA